MSAEIPKTYEPASIEATIYQLWLDNNCFTADPSAPGDPYCIVIPPPNVTGALHLGHAINDTLQDILIRNHRMRGFNTLWVPGIDHAGIATQAVVEKQLKEKENKTRHDVGREGLVERIWAWKQQYGDRILEQLKRLGCSCDWTRSRFTLDDRCARAVRETFFKLFKDGLIYRGKRLVNWDVHLQTSISDDEIYHETVKTHLWHIRYPIVDAPHPPLPPGEGRGEGNPQETSTASDSRTVSPHPNPLPEGEGTSARPTYMVVATTRPETMLGDTAVAVHSQDPRWNWAIGKSVKLPLTDRLIPIIADDILVDPKFGTGVVKVTPAHDPNDYAVWQRHQGKIDLLNIMNPDGTINQAGGKFAGMKRDAARKKVVEDLTELGLLEKEEPYETQVGHSDRSKTAVEPYLSDQWFVKMAPLAEPALQVVRDGVIKFFPERHAQQYLSWLGEKRDWPISRQLWWGHRIPVWHGWANEKETWFIEGPVTDWDAESVRRGDVTFGMTPAQKKNDPWRWWQRAVRNENGKWYIWRCIAPGYPEIEQKAEADGLVQDPDVLDTWFSSALWPHSTLGWPDQSADLAKWYPTSVLVTGRDIITLWVARMVMMGMYNMGEKQARRHEGTEARSEENSNAAASSDSSPPCLRASVPSCLSGIPFSHVAINPTILDGKGERMSKSKGNGVDPVEMIDAYGADALRFTLTMMATETQDVRMPVKKDAQGRNTSEKFDVGRNFCNKLFNATKFVVSHLQSTGKHEFKREDLALADKWILSRLMRTISEVDGAIASYRFDVYARSCYDFFWRDVCDWYLEVNKQTLRDPKQAGRIGSILAAVLDASLRLMHPMIPFITEMLWQKLNEIRPDRSLPGLYEPKTHRLLIHAAWPEVNPAMISESDEGTFTKVQEAITAIRNIRSEYKVDQKHNLPLMIIPQDGLLETFQANVGTINLLSNSTATILAPNSPPIPGSVRASTANAEIFVAGLVDANAEKQRLLKRQQELKQQIVTLQARLANESYTAKAPPQLVKQTQDQLVAAQAELVKVEAELGKL